MPSSCAAPDPLEQLVDDFAARCRRGESPSIADYAAKHPEHAGEIEELFPAVAMMEQLRAAEEEKRQAAAARQCDAPPQQVGDFDILREIGHGGMGVVYEAEQQSLARRVAVKVLPEHALASERRLECFRREAQTAARLHHTNIVAIFGVGEQDGLHYYVMPLVRGVGLDEVIRELASGGGPAGRNIHAVARELTAQKFGGPPGPVREARGGCWRVIAHIGLQAATALDYAHSQGTLHCDVKPGNLLMDAEGVVYVADFGLARATDQHGQGTREVAGTVRYMAPEQLRGLADARSDIYALGVTLYELLTLRPFTAAQRPKEQPADVAATVMGRRPTKIDPAIPRDLEAILLRCLAGDPCQRYQTAADLAEDLRRLLDDRPVRARRVSLAERGLRWCRRSPALAAMSGLAALMLMIVVVVAATAYLQTRAAFSETRQSLARAEATSQLALDALDNIYRQLSPERVWIASDSSAGGRACACVGLRAGGPDASSAQRSAMRVQASPQTAAMLENLLVFYDHLAEQGDGDRQVVLQSAIARRRLGDIRLCLGHVDQAEKEYRRAVEMLAALQTRADAGEEVCIELARSHNEIGNVLTEKAGPARACDSHEKALALLQSLDAEPGPVSEERRYELARTMYFLDSKRPGLADGRQPRAPDARAKAPAVGLATGEYRKSATRILEELTRENPLAPDYRLLLALCYRPLPGPSGPYRGPTGEQDRQRAIRILEELTAEYPAVADYRYELIATYAWIPVGLFPWQGRSTLSAENEKDLRKALQESQRLVDQHPGVPHYARSQAIVLAKLATACWAAKRLPEAEDLFQRALQAQTGVVTLLPGKPSHDQVLLEFFRLRLGQVGRERNARTPDAIALRPARALLERCIENLTGLTQRPELAGDRLAFDSLRIARETLSDLLAATGEKPKGDEATNKTRTPSINPTVLHAPSKPRT
jgi:serine/threonine protein kinase/tetratricopeptide (TPR) repeat protein